MLKKITHLFIGLGLVFSGVSCNIYAPFTTKNNENDYLEEAIKCLRNDDIACAIANYEAMPEGDTRNQKLCVSYLSRSGFTAKLMLDVVSQNTDKVLGNLSNALIPWSAQKTSDAQSAYNSCKLVTGKLGTLLSSLALIVDCSLRIAKTDQLLASSTADTTCTTPGNNSGTVTQSDIGSSGAGMCFADISACLTDIAAISSTALRTADLANIASAVDQIPAALKNTSTTVTVGRAAIASTLSN